MVPVAEAGFAVRDPLCLPCPLSEGFDAGQSSAAFPCPGQLGGLWLLSGTSKVDVCFSPAEQGSQSSWCSPAPSARMSLETSKIHLDPVGAALSDPALAGAWTQ